MWNSIFRQYLRAASLEHSYPDFPKGIAQHELASLRQMDYLSQWKYIRDNNLFHLYLSDHSFFIFKLDSPQSYSFFDCPINVLSISNYLKEIGQPVTTKIINEFQEEYDAYVTTAELKKSATPIRYDYNMTSFSTGIHPAAHIHIGLDNPIRLGLDKQLTPLAFLLFIIRQMYPDNWRKLLDNPINKTIPRKLHIDLESVPNVFFGEHEKSDLYLIGRRT